MMREALCEAFCSDVTVTPVPIGYAVKAPNLNPDGDFASFYFRKSADGETYRIEDNGCTISDLEAAGFDFDKDSRFEAFAELLTQHGILYDDRNVVIATDYMSADRLPKAAVSFSYFMARVPDLLLLVGNRIQRSFKEDLAEVIDQQFGATCSIGRNEPVDSDHRDYIVDCVVRAPDGRVLAVFAGSSELKALESLLFWEQVKTGYDQLKSMIVLEEAKPSAIKERTLSRVMNSGLVLATLDGGMVNVGQKMHMTLGRAA